MVSLRERWASQKAARRLDRIYVELLNERGREYDIPITARLARKLDTEVILALEPAADPQRLAVIRWELARRKAQPALIISILALVASLAALAVSIIWHD